MRSYSLFVFLMNCTFSFAFSTPAVFEFNQELLFQDMDRTHLQLDGASALMIPFREDFKFGFVANNENHEQIVPAMYDQVYTVSKAQAIVKKGKYYGVIDDSNDIVVPFRYDNIFKENDLYHAIAGPFINNDLPLGSREYLLNDFYSHKGELIASEHSQNHGSFVNGEKLAWFQMLDSIRVINEEGQIIKEFKQTQAFQFLGIYNGLLCYSKKTLNKFTYLGFDVLGVKQIEVNNISRGWYDGIIQLGPDFFALISDYNSLHFCNAQGELKPYKSRLSAIELKAFYPLQDLNLDELLLRVGDPEKLRIGVVNANGKTVIPFEYSKLHSFNSNISVAQEAKTGRFVFINKQGEIKGVFPNSFAYGFALQEKTAQLALGFFEGLCFASDYLSTIDTLEDGTFRNKVDLKRSYFYFFDIEGNRKVELDPSISFVGNFNEGLAPAVNKEGKLGFINREGKWQIAPKYEMTLAGSYPVPYLVVPEFKGGYAYIKSFKGYIDREGKEYFKGERMEDEYNFSH